MKYEDCITITTALYGYYMRCTVIVRRREEHDNTSEANSGRSIL